MISSPSLVSIPSFPAPPLGRNTYTNTHNTGSNTNANGNANTNANTNTDNRNTDGTTNTCGIATVNGNPNGSSTSSSTSTLGGSRTWPGWCSATGGLSWWPARISYFFRREMGSNSR